MTPQVWIPDADLQRLISEDVPYLDLTCTTLGIGEERGRGEFHTREDCIVCGTEEVARLLGMLGCTVGPYLASGDAAHSGDVLLACEGPAHALHMGWKVCLNVLDHCSAIATRTAGMVRTVHEVDPHVEVLTTRKNMPGTKQLVTKAILAGGALPHRLGLSETLLVFEQHIAFLGGMDAFIEALPQVRGRCCEKRLIVETGADDALRLARAGVDGLQFDKISPEELTGLVAQVREVSPSTVLLAAGGVNPGNAAAYAATGVDGLVTTSLFDAKPLDMSMRMMPVRS